jgi:hypothetical protein
MTALLFRDDFKRFLRFIVRPSLARRVPRSLNVTGWLVDWWPNIRLRRLLAWAATLWALNILVLGPLVLTVFELSGATHRISVHNLPWLQAILWAPVVEEMLFRFGLRRPMLALALVPLMIFVLLNGVAWWASSLLALSVLTVWWLSARTRVPSARGYRWLRRYRAVFPWVLHLSVLAFAALHLKNFIFDEMAWWMMVVLVAPQWVTGLVLSWIRVQRGVGAAMLLHGIFNAGPLSVAWLALQLLGDSNL